MNLNFPFSSRRERRGVALLVVLGSLVFIAALILAFLAGGGSEVKSSATYNDGGRVSLLAQTAVNLVEAELNDATKGVDSKGNDLAWATQPGMARTYDTTGALVKYYRLYSSPTMVGTGTVDPAPELQAMKTWYQDTAYYTDLNAPVRVSGTDRYPILPGNLVDSGGGNFAFATGSPNIAPAGFKITAPPYDPSSANRAPFPVQWLYVLEDGTVTAPQSGSGTTATVNGATASNPIVGRIAFWTDDETGKVNINTASEGGYFDTPRVSSKYDYSVLAANPPAKNEFQRYPGHPATTSLSAVFGSLLPVPSLSPLATSNPLNGGNYTSQLKPYYNLAPKVADGGSQAGTTAATTAVSPDADRLYASVDELLYKPDRTKNAGLNATAVDQSRFFATAHSRSPDLNLFNRPRVAVWPVSNIADDDHRTADDRLIAQAATVNNVPYYFVRSDWKSQTELSLGKNRSLISYLRALCAKPIPGAQGGGTFANKYNTPGTKGTEVDQILTEIFDYVRCVNVYDTSSGRATFVPFNNIAPKSVASGEVVPTYDATTDTKGFGRFPTIAKAGVLFIAAADPTYQTPTNNAASATAVATGKVRLQAALVFQLFDPAQGYPGLYPDATINVLSSSLSWNFGTGNLFKPGTLRTNPINTSTTRFWGGNLGFRILRSWPYGSTQNNNYPLISMIEATTPLPEAVPNTPTVPSTFHFNGGQIHVTIGYGTTVVQDLTINFQSGDFPVPAMPTPTSFASSSSTTYNVYDFASRFNQSVATGSGATIREVMTFTQNDVLRDVQSSTGDYRLSAALATVSSNNTDRLFAKHGDWGDSTRYGAHSFKEPDGTDYNGAGLGLLTPTASGSYGYWNSSDISNSSVSVQPRHYDNTNKYTSGVTGWTTSVTPDGIPTYLTTGSTAGSSANWSTGNPLGDWDNGTASVMDGSYINLPDEGTADAPAYYGNNSNASAIVGTTFSAPNRLMPSPVMLGSLPTGVFATASGTLQPWQTLLFHNDPTGKHLGARVAPMDHFLLDLFTMPVVEPYAITEPLSTDGRINMNYQIFPFTYINRDTGIRAVLKSERMLAVANKYSGIGSVAKYDVYKQLDGQSSTRYKNFSTGDFRYDINPDETLKGFQARFAQNDLFRSPSEICTLDLIPNDTGAAYGSMLAYWENHTLTGDNSREKPYADIYPRLTTRSNTFTIHFRVQALKQAGGASAVPNQWREGIDTVTAEYRGSRLIERYIDPTNTKIPDYTDTTVKTPISQFYRFRVLEAKSFPQ